MGRLQDIAARDVLTLLIGEGPGSDIKVGAIWIEPLPSHQSFLTYTYEYGFIGLVAVSIIFALMARMGRPYAFPLIAAVVVSGFIGNGISIRPNIFILFCVGSCIWRNLAAVDSQEGLNRRIELGRYVPHSVDGSHRGLRRSI
jgi:hypothetical protein